MIITDKKLKKKLDKIPDTDKNGELIFKIAEIKDKSSKDKDDKKTGK